MACATPAAAGCAQPLGYFTHYIGILRMIAALAYAAMTVLRKSE